MPCWCQRRLDRLFWDDGKETAAQTTMLNHYNVQNYRKLDNKRLENVSWSYESILAGTARTTECMDPSCLVSAVLTGGGSVMMWRKMYSPSCSYLQLTKIRSSQTMN
ncbi:hypothetical protein ATANTOWER_013094 [Ataeniobius toweri]|uniref:Uncharacterized protein n=1 Tax=Ataeniobius toweri TaxID=208326 RepID=A0ABU7C7H3_9TELE|nr:hypothetical protein [Ataeniobius toweri]